MADDGNKRMSKQLHALEMIVTGSQESQVAADGNSTISGCLFLDFVDDLSIIQMPN